MIMPNFKTKMGDRYFAKKILNLAQNREQSSEPVKANQV